MVVLFIVFATAMAIATFIENDFGTPTARTLVYNSHWFEALMILLAINLTGNIIRFKMDQRKKWAVFIFHLAFLIILLGAAITRYISFEGMMSIREGETTDTVLSDKVYLKIDAVDQDYQNLLLKELKLSRIDFPFLTDNHYQTAIDYKGKQIKIKVLEYIPGAVAKFIPDDKGAVYLPIVVSAGEGRKNLHIKDGATIEIAEKRIGFNQVNQRQINIFTKNDSLFILSPFEGTWMRMSDQQNFPVVKDSVMPLQFASLYRFGAVNFVITQQPVKGKIEYVAGSKNTPASDLLRIEVDVDGERKILDLKGGQYQPENPKRFELNGVQLSVNFGSAHWRLPFQIQLRDFQLENYPGSKMPKSYASEVTVIDQNSSFDFRIYMNHVLDYKGYRFYQSAYSITPEYEETQLSVNHDKLGTWTTYFGYALLYFGLIMIFFVKGSRFYKLRKMLKKIQAERQKTALIIAFGLTFFSAVQAQEARINTDSIVIQTVAPAEKAEAFGHLIIQDYGGRMKPVNTYASELLRKLTKHDTYQTGNGQKYSADQILTGMISYPQGWWYVPLIYLERGDEKLREIIGVDKNTKYARLVDFFNENGDYKLQSYIEKAQKKRIKSKFDKDIINVSGRVNLLYNTLLGENLRLFPLPDDPKHQWYSWTQIDHLEFNKDDKNFAKNAIPLWAKEIFKAKTTGDYQLADQILDGINQYQKRFGKDVYPPEKRIKREIFYNKYDAFRSLFWQFMMLSLVIFIIAIAQVFSNKKLWNYILKGLYFIALLLFIWMMIFMGLRWDISGHAPWSNAYESMIYVSFAIILFSLILGRKSALVLSAGLFVGSMTLMIAHWNWMDPQIENLVPVLNSYWLDIHVSIIVASYGPFAIGMILGLLSLLLIALTNDKNKEKLKLQIKELTIITEMALTIGLVMLTIGNFLGGQWANESWGRYWGWDPKETWALISIVVYALVIHARFVPGLRGYFTFNLLAVISFASILMTYFGVNFYLSGLHSYAKGEPQETPVFIYYAIAFIGVLSIIAYYKYKKYFKHR